jgi:mRNA interferase HigB
LYDETTSSDWSNPNELKTHYRNASILSEKRVIFNIHGNSFRLIVNIEYRLKIIFIVWFGTHKDYDQLGAKTISYVKTHKNDAQYEVALESVYNLLQANLNLGSKESDELEVLSILIKSYEIEHDDYVTHWDD